MGLTLRRLTGDTPLRNITFFVDSLCGRGPRERR